MTTVYAVLAGGNWNTPTMLPVSWLECVPDASQPIKVLPRAPRTRRSGPRPPTPSFSP